MKYYWIRIYDYNLERDQRNKGILLEEFYLKGETISKEDVKEQIKDKYNNITIKFAKPRKNNGLYAIILDSNKFFYDNFYCTINGYCFYCHKNIKGKASDFPNTTLKENVDFLDIDLEDKDTVFFCNHDCKNKFFKNLRYEGEFQEKEPGENGNIFGYIYLIYNRVENKYYIGQTRYMPFFRWQEHIKNNSKGNITDLTFNVITEVRRNLKLTESQNQEYLNNIEAWWISKYKEEGKNIFNITIPKLTLDDYKTKYNNMIKEKMNQKLIQKKVKTKIR